jgi:DNA-binding SARP family transcriptional activator
VEGHSVREEEGQTMVPAETQQILDETSGRIYPIQFVQVGSLHDVPAPLVRVSTCGGLQLEVLQEVISTDSAQGRYQVVTLQNRPKGSSTGLTLLKILASLPEHYASKDWLTEHLPRTRSTTEEDEQEWGQGLIRVDNVVYLLRGLLCPPGIVGEETIRKVLVAYVRNHRESGPGYRLAADPLVWLDVDMIAASVKQALHLELEGNEALPCWEQVYALASKGIYLPDEAYSDWARDTRLRVEGYLRQAVHALRRLYLLRESKAGEEQAIVLLRSYWQTHLTDEDVLRPLMELLAKHDGAQEALEYYQHLCERLASEGGTPDERTLKTAQSLSIRQNTYGHASEKVLRFTVSSMLSSHQSAMPSSSPHKNTDNLSEEQPFNSGFLNSTGIPVASPSFLRTDVDVLTHLTLLINKTSVVNEREIGYFDQQTRLYWHAREETALPATTLYIYVIRHIDDITLLLARSHLPILRSYLCEIICRTVLLAGILLYDMGQYAQARQQYSLAFQAAKEANNLVLQAIVWGWTSFTWTYTKSYMEALGCAQYAHSFAIQTKDRMMQAWLGAIEAEIHAHLGDHGACLQALSDMEHNMGGFPSHDISYLFEFNPVLLLGYKGVCLQQFYQRQVPATHRLLQEAKESLELALASEAPLKRKLYYLTDLAGVHARQGEVETACSYIIQSIPFITQVGSGSKTIRKHLLQARTLLQPYEQTSFVEALDRQMAPLLIGGQTEES